MLIKYSWTFQFGCQMVPLQGVNLPFLRGFNCHPLEGAGSYIMILLVSMWVSRVWISLFTAGLVQDLFSNTLRSQEWVWFIPCRCWHCGCLVFWGRLALVQLLMRKYHQEWRSSCQLRWSYFIFPYDDIHVQLFFRVDMFVPFVVNSFRKATPFPFQHQFRAKKVLASSYI